MRRIWSARPSPTLVVAILALVAAVTGAAVAQPAAKKAVTKKKVKKIATKQINKLAPGLSVANADTAGDANTVGGKPASAFASSAVEPFHRVGAPGQPQFQNGWTNEDLGATTDAAFYKDPLGVVHLKGQISNSTSGQTNVFVLPQAYRPTESYQFNLPAGPVSAVLVHPDGRVNVGCSGPSCHASLDGATFRAGS